MLHRYIFPTFHCSKNISDLERCWEHKEKCEYYNFILKYGGYSASCRYALHSFILLIFSSFFFLYLFPFFFFKFHTFYVLRNVNFTWILLSKIQQVLYTKSYIFLFDISDEKYSLIFLQGEKLPKQENIALK